MNIFLIGFMGSGKTKLGTYLGRKFDCKYFDLDDLIVKKSGKSIPEIFEESGEDAFREMEKAALRSISDAKELQIISCGGGTPCFFDNMDWMNENGHTIYLQLSPGILLGRLKNATNERPLLREKEDLRAFITDLLEKREKWYLKANTILKNREADKKPLREVVEAIIAS